MERREGGRETIHEERVNDFQKVIKGGIGPEVQIMKPPNREREGEREKEIKKKSKKGIKEERKSFISKTAKNHKQNLQKRPEKKMFTSKQIVMYSFKETLSFITMTNRRAHNFMEESHKHNVEHKKPIMKEHIIISFS